MQSSWCHLRQASCSYRAAAAWCNQLPCLHIQPAAGVCTATATQHQQQQQHRHAAPAAASRPSAAVACLRTPKRDLSCCSTSSRQGEGSLPAQDLDSSSSSSSSSKTDSESGIISYAPSSLAGWVVNKQPINASMTPELYTYMLSLTKEQELLAALREETAGIHGSQMQVSPEQGQFMSVLVKLLGVKSAIEVGVFTGYSSLAVALALPPEGRLYAFDRDAQTMAVAKKYWQLAGVADKVVARLGPGLEGLQQLLQDKGPDSFDFAFIDADKGGYQTYFDLCLQLVRPGGCIAVDNVLFYGRVIDPARDDRATVAIRGFNEALAADSRVEYSIVPIGDGVALCRKL